MNQLLNSSELQEYSAFLGELADAAATITLDQFRKPMDVINKGRKLSMDFDPVTEADQNAERAIRDLIRAKYPEHDILGEEHGEENFGPDGWVDRWKWVIDPIDGTRAFICGIPTWGTLVALNNGQEPVLGMLDQPFLKERYVGSAEGSFLNGNPIQCRPCENLSDAVISTTDPVQFFATEEDRQTFENLAEKCNLMRNGYDCYAYVMLASGYIDIVMESGLEAYDIQALIPIVEGAGGIVTDWQGGAADQGGQVLACGDKALHKQILELINS